MIDFNEYANLSSSVKKQITNISKIYRNNSDIVKLQNEIIKKRNNSDDTAQDTFNLALLQKYNTKSLIEDHYKLLECYSDVDDDKVKLTRIIKKKRHAVIVEGTYNARRVVVKYYEKDDKGFDTNFEINIYKKLHKLGSKLPWYSDKFMILNKRVLVIEKLEKLDKTDNINKIGTSIVAQLSYLHTFAMHNDIKPDNIMKKTIDGKREYFLIDYGGVSIEKFCCGYRRRIWTEDWTCQKKGEHDQLTYPKHDFTELAITLNFIHNGFSYKDYKTICKNHLGKFNSFINKLNKQNYSEIDYNHVVSLFK